MLDTLILEDATAGQPGGFDVSVTIHLLQLPLERGLLVRGAPGLSSSSVGKDFTAATS